MQLPQERQAGCRLAVEQHEHHREVLLLHAPVDRLVIFGDLPGADAILADQQDKGRCFSDFLDEFGQPEAARAQALECEKDVRLGVLAPQRRLKPLHEREVLRIVTEEPAPHSLHRVDDLLSETRPDRSPGGQNIELPPVCQRVCRTFRNQSR